MQRLIELAGGIENTELRKKVIELIKNPKLSNTDFQKYPKGDLEKVKTPFSVGDMGVVVREVINHTVTNTELCWQIADTFEKNYGVKVNRDVLIAGSLLHDIMKVYEWKIDEEGDPIPTGLTMDHVFLGVAELYARGFSEEIIHVVAATQGERTPPKSLEALILHYVDTLTSLTEFFTGARHKKPQTPVIVLDEETFKKMKEEKD
ncbi:MAG: HDIG domain-containing protein [Candidatus Aenigmarchaeota archaeon]|nr:HDIG domain-containing protein [Candidatus Aenigmarchaeota archaeon]